MAIKWVPDIPSQKDKVIFGVDILKKATVFSILKVNNNEKTGKMYSVIFSDNSISFYFGII